MFAITWYTYFNISAWLYTSFIYLTFWCIYSMWITIWVVYKSSYKNVYKIWLLFIGEHVNSYVCQFLGTSGCRPSKVKRRVLGCSYFYLVTAVNLIMATLKCNISLPHEWVLWAVPKTLLQLSHKLPGLRSIRRTITSFTSGVWVFLFSNCITIPFHGRIQIQYTTVPSTPPEVQEALFPPPDHWATENCPSCNVTENDFSQVIHQ